MRKKIYPTRVFDRISLICCMAITACGGDSTAPHRDPAQVYWQLTLNHEAITLAMAAPFDTVQLEATARLFSGTVHPIEPSVTYSVAGNDTSVIITPDGLLTAHVPTNGVTVYATGKVGNITLKDSVRVVVNAIPVIPAPPMLGGIKLQLDGAPNLTVDCSRIESILSLPWVTLTAQPLDQATNPIPNTAVSLSSSNPDVFTVSRYTGEITMSCVQPGRVMLYATTTVYGVSTRDSLEVLVTHPSVRQVELLSPDRNTPSAPCTFAVKDVTIVAGGIVHWSNFVGCAISDIMFDSPSAASDAGDTPIYGGMLGIIPSTGSGNMTDIVVASCNKFDIVCALTKNTWVRRFQDPGEYRYRVLPSNTEGRVIVRAPIS
jgi:hypothetical protein